MFIRSFEYEDLRTGWKLERTEFDAFNLLVGNSGVGKTKILRALTSVAGLALGRTFMDFRWRLEFRRDETSYVWSGRVARDRTAPSFTDERLLSEHTTLFRRSAEQFIFQSIELPRLSHRISGLELLSEEESIRPLRDSLGDLFIQSEVPPRPLHVTRYSGDSPAAQNLAELISARKAEPLHILEIAYIVFSGLPEIWRGIVDAFCAIFTTVEDVAVLRANSEGDDTTTYALELVEHGSPVPIPHDDIASGMSRTLGHLIEIAVAPKGAVILIDEFENSLGANCMPEVVRLLNSRPDLQFIITSHHPYVINNIPKDTWKLVQRKGSTVHVTSARDIPALQDASHHQAYLRLVNLPEFEEGIA